MWARVISLRERQPLNAIVSSNSSRSIWSTFLTPVSPSEASEKTTGRPICHQEHHRTGLNSQFLLIDDKNEKRLILSNEFHLKFSDLEKKQALN